MSPARVPYKSSTLGVFLGIWGFSWTVQKKTTFGFFVLLEFFVGCKKVKLFRRWGLSDFFSFSVKKLNCRTFCAFAAHKEGSLISIVSDTRVNSWNLSAHTQKW